MPLADVTNTHHHRSANSHIVVAPLQKRVSSAMSATNTATKLTDMFGKKNVAASSSSKTDEEEDFFASCAKDEAVVRKGTAPFCFTRLFLLLLSYLYVVSMRHKRARARQLFTSLFFGFGKDFRRSNSGINLLLYHLSKRINIFFGNCNRFMIARAISLLKGIIIFLKSIRLLIE